MWMHNGGIGAWKHVKRRLTMSLADRWFLGVQGSTDSEWAFALFLDRLERAGVDPDAEPGVGGFGHAVLRRAMTETIRCINDFVGDLSPEEIDDGGIDARSILNFAVTDGHSVVCTRYIGSATDEAASLYFSSGTSWMDEGDGEFKMERRDKGSDIVLVASEPLTFERGETFYLFLFRSQRNKWPS
jgi:glutamine amidotransferase